jgi:hypothetical protein
MKDLKRIPFVFQGSLKREEWNITVAEIIPERRQEIVAKFGVCVVERSVPFIHNSGNLKLEYN